MNSHVIRRQITCLRMELSSLFCLIVLCVLCNQCTAQCSSPTEILEATEEKQVLHSPNYPDSYYSNIECSWLITSPVKTGRILLEVAYHQIACCCNGDNLIVYDGVNASSRAIAVLCSDVDPVTITSSGPALYGQFNTDDETVGLGYSLFYSYYDSSVSCPPGWLERAGNCYKVYPEITEWQDAASRCGYDAGFLTSIATEDENQFLVDNLTSSDQYMVAWIGLNNTELWIDGSNVSFENYEDGRPGEGQCATLKLSTSSLTSSNGGWLSVDCADSFNFICENTKDGSGDRYWTSVDDIIADKGGGLPSFVFPIIMVVLFVVFSCWCSSERRQERRNPLECCCALLSCITDGIGSVFSCIQEALRGCLDSTCKCCRSSAEGDSGQSEVEARRQTEHPGTGDRSRPSAESFSSDESSLGLRGSIALGSAPSGPPPSYGDVTDEPPPPSYVEALDPTFDMSATAATSVSTSDLRPGLYVTTERHPQPAPSYESVVNENYSDSNV